MCALFAAASGATLRSLEASGRRTLDLRFYSHWSLSTVLKFSSTRATGARARSTMGLSSAPLLQTPAAKPDAILYRTQLTRTGQTESMMRGLRGRHQERGSHAEERHSQRLIKIFEAPIMEQYNFELRRNQPKRAKQPKTFADTMKSEEADAFEEEKKISTIGSGGIIGRSRVDIYKVRCCRPMPGFARVAASEQPHATGNSWNEPGPSRALQGRYYSHRWRYG